MIATTSSFLFLSFCVIVTTAINPVVFFPGYTLSKFIVTVNGGNVSGCPTNGSFTAEWQMDIPQNNFTNECIAKYLTLIYDNQTKKFSNWPGVTVEIPGRDTGKLECLHTLYKNLTDALITAGLVADLTVRSACYDWRMAPTDDVIGLDNPGFLLNTANVIEAAYNSAGKKRVYLIAHSNGPIMASYFMKKYDPVFIKNYIAGYITLSGNIPGQACWTMIPALGFTPKDFSFDPVWTPPAQSWPSNPMTQAQPDYYTVASGRNVTVLTTSTRSYSTNVDDINALLEAAGATFLRANWNRWNGLVTPQDAPPVWTYAFYGANIDTIVGLKVDSIPITSFNNSDSNNFYYLKGDINQEYIDNEAILNWKPLMKEGCFDHMELPNVDHFAENQNATVINKILEFVKSDPPVICSGIEKSLTVSKFGIFLVFFVMGMIL